MTGAEYLVAWSRALRAESVYMALLYERVPHAPTICDDQSVMCAFCGRDPEEMRSEPCEPKQPVNFVGITGLIRDSDLIQRGPVTSGVYDAESGEWVVWTEPPEPPQASTA